MNVGKILLLFSSLYCMNALTLVTIICNLYVYFIASNQGLRTHEGSIPNFLQPKFKSQSQINIWDLDIKGYTFVEIMVD